MQKQLFVRSGSHYRPAKSVEVLDAAAFAEARQVEVKGPALNGPFDAIQFLIRQLRHLPYEAMTVLFLSPGLKVIGVERIFRGSIDSSPVFIREIAREVIMRDATGIIIAHNHPSGDARPSNADRRTTSVLVAAMAMIETQVLDHVIVAGDDHYSFVQGGLMPDARL